MLTIYIFILYRKEAQKCYCESYNCRGWIGGEPESEEELESDDDDESEEETIGKDDGDLSTESKVTSTTDDLVKKKVKTPKPKKPKDATKKPPRKERASKANRKSVTDFKKHMKRAEIMEDPDLDMEIDVLSKNGLKNQVQTLQLSRLMGMCKHKHKMDDFVLFHFRLFKFQNFSACKIAKSQSSVVVVVA